MRIKIIFFLITTTILFYAQSIYTPLENGVYLFLERMSVKQIVYVHNEVKPWTNKEILQYLKVVEDKKAELTNSERKQLEYFLEEFGESAQIFDLLPVRYKDEKFSLSGNIMASASYGVFGDANVLKRKVGINFYGSYNKWFNAYIRFSDAGETGDAYDDLRNISPERGYDFFEVDNGIEYSDIIGGLVIDFDWGNIRITKDYQNWGSGRDGQLILSDKTVSYPALSVTLKPVNWFRFYYMHGWLNSGVVDSSSIRRINSSNISSPESYSFIPKYIATNMLTLTYKGLIDYSLGNSIVYWGDIRPEMFIPFMFFKYLDRDTGKGVFNDGNGQIFVDLSLYYPKNFNFYATVFFDVLSIKSIVGDFRHSKWLGYTFGGKHVGLFGQGIDLFAEYTRISPWVYEHKDDATTYKHIDYTLGHWIGQNADLLTLGVNYYPRYDLFVSFYAKFLRKGGLLDIWYAYNGNVDEEFLYGERHNETVLGLKIKYDLLPYLKIVAEGAISDVTDELPGRTKSFYLGNNNSFSLGFSYGM